MLKTRSILIALVMLFAVSAAFGQDDDPIRIDSANVRMNIGVVDRTGRPIVNLRQENFAIYEDGVKQDISYFETNTAPFSVVMLLDMSGSTKSFRQNIKLSAMRFLDALGPNDRLSVIEFHDRIRVLNNFTTDRRRALHSINVANGIGKTDLYGAIDFSIDRLAKEKSVRKAIVILTDGVDTESQNADREMLSKLSEEQMATAIDPESNPRLNKMLDRSHDLGVTIYPLALPTGDPARLADPTTLQVSMFKASRDRLQIIANRTGGTLNTIIRLEEMGRLYAEVAADLRTLYTIEYTSTNTTRDGKWRAIKVETSVPDLVARSRQGYYAR